MKDIEKLKLEQEQLKEKLHKLIDFINSEEYYELNINEKSLLSTQRTGMEIYLNALTKRIYGVTEQHGDSFLPLMLTSLLGSPFGYSNTYESVAKQIEEKQSEKQI